MVIPLEIKRHVNITVFVIDLDPTVQDIDFILGHLPQAVVPVSFFTLFSFVILRLDLRPLVRFYVRFQAVRSGERPAARRLFASVGPLPAVYPLVGLQVVAGGESLAAPVLLASTRHTENFY